MYCNYQERLLNENACLKQNIQNLKIEIDNLRLKYNQATEWLSDYRKDNLLLKSDLSDSKTTIRTLTKMLEEK